jgi:arginine exporter protein ArgO
MHPAKEVYYGYKLFKALAVAAVAGSILFADCITGFKKIDATTRWICLGLTVVGSLCTLYYWRCMNRRHSEHREHRSASHFSQRQPAQRNPPAKLPPRRDQTTSA